MLRPEFVPLVRIGPDELLLGVPGFGVPGLDADAARTARSVLLSCGMVPFLSSERSFERERPPTCPMTGL